MEQISDITYKLVIPTLGVVILGIAVIVLGLVWAPIGGLICKWLARQNENEWAAAVRQRGSVSSRHLLVWLHMVFLITGRPLPGTVIATGYIATSLLWLTGPVGLLTMLAISFLFSDFVEGESIVVRVLLGLLSGGAAYFNGWLLYRSWKQMLASRRRRQQRNLPSLAIPVPTGYTEFFDASYWPYVTVPLLYLLLLGVVSLTYF